MEKITGKKITKEGFVILFYVGFFIAIYFTDILFPSHSPHGPGNSFIFILALIPSSIGYFIFQLAKFIGDKSYGKCLAVHLLVWIGLFVFISLG